jgi:hypothetical protein
MSIRLAILKIMNVYFVLNGITFVWDDEING